MQNNIDLYKWKGLISQDSEKRGPGDRPDKGIGDPGWGDGRQNRRWKNREQLSEQQEVNEDRGLSRSGRSLGRSRSEHLLRHEERWGARPPAERP